MTEFLTFMA